MSYEDFLDEFNLLSVAEIIDNASYVYRCVKDEQCKGAYFSIDIFK